MKRELSNKAKINKIAVFEKINERYIGRQKILLNNCSMAFDGLLYFVVAKTQTFSQNVSLVVCNAENILFETDILINGNHGVGGAVYDGHIGIFACSSDYGYICHVYEYDIDANTITNTYNVNTERNWHFSRPFAYKSGEIHYVVSAFNNVSRGPTTVCLDNGSYYINELTPRNDMAFFLNGYSDTDNPFLAISGTRPSDGTQDFFIKKLPGTYNITTSSGAALSNGISNSLANYMFPLFYYDNPFKIHILADTPNGNRLVHVSDDYTSIRMSNTTFPTGYNISLQVLLSCGIGYYCDSSYNYQSYRISDYCEE